MRTTLRWGIIGCGDVAERKGGPALSMVEGSELVAVMRRDAGKAADFAERHGAKRSYVKTKDLLDDPDVNAVYVATPVHLHHRHTLEAAEAGKHVLCEKPMAMTCVECREMIAACQRNNVRLMVAYYRRTYPIVQRMKLLLEQGAVGRPLLARINLTSYYDPPRADREVQWRVDPDRAGGGVLFDVGSHRLDVLVYLFGGVREVAAFAASLHCSYHVEDSAVLCRKLGDSMHGVANFNWNIGSTSDELEIYGTKGKMLARPLDQGRLEIHHGTKIEVLELPPPEITHTGLVQSFLHAVQARRPLICSGEESMKTNAIMEAAYRSAATGRHEKADEA